MKNYSLEHYAGKSSRHECPACKDPHSFTLYVDDSGNPLHPTVGRCNHESGCSYHYTPKEYFQEHPEDSSSKDFSFCKPIESKSVSVIDYIPYEYVEKSLSTNSNFMCFLMDLLNKHEHENATSNLNRLMADYHIGATKNGSIIYWQIDRDNKVRTGKVMQYNPEDGHRVKTDGGVNWIHSILKKQGILPEEWHLSQCLFGEHLLSKYPERIVVLVEAEKSALVGAAVYPNFIWLATGGKSQMSMDKLCVLTGRTVLLFPDVDGYQEWKERAKAMTFCKTRVSDLLETEATPQQRKDKIDIADLLIYQINRDSLARTDTHMAEAEEILQQMIAKNPCLQKLIDALDLELVDGWHDEDTDHRE
jgi:hypothetical protein